MSHRHTQLTQVRIGQLTERVNVNCLSGKRICVLVKTEPAKPIVNVTLHILAYETCRSELASKSGNAVRPSTFARASN